MDTNFFLNCSNEKINTILRFTAEADKMTSILRRTLLVDGSRRENDAEHSWHIALMAMLFKDFAPEGVHIERSVQMCVVHDLVEIYAGDTFAYDVEGNKDKLARETEAARRLFSQLPDNIGSEIRALWEEFDAMETPDAKYAACMDRAQPFLHNMYTGGHTWIQASATRNQIEERMAVIKEFMPPLYEWIHLNIDEGIRKGWISG